MPFKSLVPSPSNAIAVGFSEVLWAYLICQSAIPSQGRGCGNWQHGG